MSIEFNLRKRLDEFEIDVGLELSSELVVLFGPSGAGKTMVLKMLSGIVEPDGGRVLVDGRTLFDSSRGVDVPIRKRKIGYLFQEYALFPHMTVRGNISYGVEGDPEAKVRELVEVTRLRGLEQRYPAELSGGQKQRTALARTLATEPRVLLLDEPFSALDYQVREKLRSDLLRIHDLYPVTTVLVTHDLEEAFMLGTRIAVINEGRIEQFGSREEVFYRPRTKNVARFMGVKNIFTGRVKEAGPEGAVVVNPELGEVKTTAPGHQLKPGSEVTFCIRPEEIPVIRPGRELTGSAKENVLSGVVTSTVGHGTTHTLFMRVGDTEAYLKIEVPNFVYRKLGLATGLALRVSLKKESIWIIP